jgi:hypothetical protein
LEKFSGLLIAFILKNLNFIDSVLENAGKNELLGTAAHVKDGCI